MRTPEGDVTLCPGCSATGTYIGPLDEPRVEEDSYYGNLALFSPDREDYIVLVDEGGGKSEAVYMGNAIKHDDRLSEEDDVKAGIAVEQRIYERVGRCLAGTVCQSKQCPGFNSETVTKAINEEYTKVLAAHRPEGQ